MSRTAIQPARSVIFVLVSVLVLVCAAAYADVKLPVIIGDNMVLQQGVQAPIWGWADRGEKIHVRLGDSAGSYETTADKDGKWLIKIGPLEAGKTLDLTVTGKNTINVRNVLAGEVWVCSGQSNMQWSVQRAIDGEKEIAAADYPHIRLFTVQRNTSGQPLNDCVGTWTECSPATIAEFSAVAYFFGRNLHKELNLPIGLINTSWGGTRIEPWTPPVGFASVPELKSISNEIAGAEAEYSKTVAESLGAIEQWVRETKAALEENRPLPPTPTWPTHPLNSNRQPTGLYNAMINPLVPLAIGGAIWYQGESNREDGLLYHQKMQALINGWRKVWNEGDFPFYYVQLAPFRYGGDPLLLPQIWEAQNNALAMPGTGMAVITDITNLTNIHPQNKQDVGKRLALWALARTYGRKDLVYSGPLYKSMSVEGNKIRIRFEHVGGGLASRDGQGLNWFTIAGDDKNFVEAQAQIDGATVLVWSDKLDKPVAVRFGWNQEAEPNLMNKEGLPASPFRTDKWPVGEKSEK
ncbi:MAG TPA: sialate O-acetylesterase [Sedimentisphaerales bacterium]|nr:sialate O-acetylesterase [Sedimentisphaerales bacterium]